MRLYTSERGVQSQLPHRYAHTTRTEVTQTQDTLTVRHHDGSHICLRPEIELYRFYNGSTTCDFTPPDGKRKVKSKNEIVVSIDAVVT